MIMGDKMMPFDTSYIKTAWAWVNDVWAKSLAAIVLFYIGLWIGGVMAEARIVSDCKFAGSFRADIQAFNCQRRI
jgi:hypothetical protein